MNNWSIIKDPKNPSNWHVQKGDIKKMISIDFIPKFDHHGLDDGTIYTVEGSFDYSIGHFMVINVFYVDMDGGCTSLKNDILTGFIYQNHEQITEQVKEENNINQNDNYLLAGSSVFGLVLNGTSHSYPPNFNGDI